MYRAGLFAVFAAALVLSSGVVGQDQKTDPKTKQESKAPPTKAKGVLPRNWSKIGLTDVQIQDIYKIQNKYNKDIAALDAKIKELKAARDKEEKAVLTPEQKKRLEEILLGKDK